MTRVFDYLTFQHLLVAVLAGVTAASSIIGTIIVNVIVAVTKERHKK